MAITESDAITNYKICVQIDIVSPIRVRGLNWIGHINRVADTRKLEQIVGSQPEGVRTRGGSRSGFKECVWTDIEKGGISDWGGNIWK